MWVDDKLSPKMFSTTSSQKIFYTREDINWHFMVNRLQYFNICKDAEKKSERDEKVHLKPGTGMQDLSRCR